MDLFEKKNISPMLLYQVKPFNDDNYIFELKLDGVRCIAYLDKNETILRNKRNKDVTDIYPELSDIYKCANEKCILDGELVVISNGKPDFFSLQKRSLMGDSLKIAIASKRNPVQFVAYDILYCGKKDLTQLTLMERKSFLKNNIKEGFELSVSRFIEREGIAFFELAKKQGLEGVVGKKKNGKYYIGKRTKEWVKIKVMQEDDLIICGYEEDENGNPKDLILGYYDKNKKIQSRGKIYLGVSENDSLKILNTPKVSKPWFDGYNDAIWLKLQLVGTAQYMHFTESGNMRQPVFKGLRDDKRPADCIISDDKIM